MSLKYSTRSLDGTLISQVLSHPIQILTQGKNPGITWKYALPKVMNVTQPTTKRYQYTWHTVQSDCSVSCGGGKRFLTSASQLISAYRFYPVYIGTLWTLGNPNAVRSVSPENKLLLAEESSWLPIIKARVTFESCLRCCLKERHINEKQRTIPRQGGIFCPRS